MNYLEQLRQHRITTWITWLLRIVVGVTFIFSGFVKAIDPWGTIYKFSEYLSALGIHFTDSLLLCAVFILFSAEFMIGVFLLLGCFRRLTTWTAAAFMVVMLPLTLWVAASDPVSDCGCFGDALIISNWATFWKNVALSFCLVWLILFNRKAHWIVTPALQWLAFIFSAAYVVMIGLYGYVVQPMIDFRPYPEGTRLYEADTEENDESDNLKFVYEKDGAEKEFGINDELPDESQGWTFVRRIEDSKAKSAARNSGNFHFWDEEEEDVTADVLDSASDHMLLLMPDVNSVSAAITWRINSLYDWCRKNGIAMEAIAAGSEEEINFWKDLSMPSYPIYMADDTLIKEVSRGNPSAVYVHDGIIKWKSTLSSIDADDFMAPETSGNPMSFRRDMKSTLNNYTYLYLIAMGVLIGLSFLPSLKSVFESERWHRFTHAPKNDKVDKADPTETSHDKTAEPSDISHDDTVRREE